MSSLSKDQIKKAVIEVLGELAKRVGHSKEITSESDPISGVGLASEDGVEFECILEEILEIQLPGGMNPFVDDKQNRSRNVDQIVDFIFEKATVTKGVQRGRN